MSFANRVLHPRVDGEFHRADILRQCIGVGGFSSTGMAANNDYFTHVNGQYYLRGGGDTATKSRDVCSLLVG